MATLRLEFVPPTPAPSNGYLVQYRQVGTTTYSTLSPNPTASPIVINGLSVGQYEGSVQSICGVGDLSSPVPFLSNTLDCSVGIDMVFVLDITGSMSSTLSNLKTSISSYTDKVVEKSNNNYRFALVTVDENSGGPIISKPVSFSTNNEAELLTGLNAVVLGTGGGAPEPTDVAIGYVLENSDNYVGLFRTGVVKIIVLMTDQLPGGTNDSYDDVVDRNRVIQLSNLAQDTGVRIFAIRTGSDVTTPPVSEIMQIYTNTSLGIYSESPTGVVSSAIIDALDALCNN